MLLCKVLCMQISTGTWIFNILPYFANFVDQKDDVKVFFYILLTLHFFRSSYEVDRVTSRLTYSLVWNKSKCTKAERYPLDPRRYCERIIKSIEFCFCAIQERQTIVTKKYCDQSLCWHFQGRYWSQISTFRNIINENCKPGKYY